MHNINFLKKAMRHLTLLLFISFMASSCGGGGSKSYEDRLADYNNAIVDHVNAVGDQILAVYMAFDVDLNKAEQERIELLNLCDNSIAEVSAMLPFRKSTVFRDDAVKLLKNYRSFADQECKHMIDALRSGNEMDLNWAYENAEVKMTQLDRELSDLQASQAHFEFSNQRKKKKRLF